MLGPLPELQEVRSFCIGRCGPSYAPRYASLCETNASDSTGSTRFCRLDVVKSEIVKPSGFHVPGAPLSDHYGLATTFTVAC